MRYEAAVRTVTGNIRGRNEDNYYFAGSWRDSAVGETGAVQEGQNRRVLFAVCDGMGGESYGEEASLGVAGALVTVEDRLLGAAEPDFVAEMLRFSQEQNEALLDRMRRHGGVRMGTTLSSLFLTRGTVEAFNIGDSPVLLLRDRRLHWLSRRHTHAARLVEMGVISEAEARRHPERHRLVQHLGLFPEEKTLEPTRLEPLRLREDDRFLIASDGITDMLEEDEITRLLAEAPGAEEAATVLIEAALAAGGKDNATALVIVIREVTEQDRALYARYPDDGRIHLTNAVPNQIRPAVLTAVPQPRPAAPGRETLERPQQAGARPLQGGFAEGDEALRTPAPQRPGDLPAAAPRRVAATEPESPAEGRSAATIAGQTVNTPPPAAEIAQSGVRVARDPSRYQLTEEEIARFEAAREEARLRQMSRGEEAGRPAGSAAPPLEPVQPERPPVTVTSILEEEEPPSARRQKPFQSRAYREALPPAALGHDASLDYQLERRAPSSGERVRRLLGHLLFFACFVALGAGIAWLFFNWSRIARSLFSLLP
ncbi:MAG: protein phosphatase 2C domain-containing protein [Bacillota bacterium]|nr:protein phosphatase 2C domain-containing protein [Bacillota bacterium]